MFQDEVTLLTLKPEAAKVNEAFQKLGIKVTGKDSFEKLVPDQGTHLIVIHNTEHTNASVLEGALKNDGFVLAVAKLGQKAELDSSKFNLVAKKVTPEQEFYLYRKVSESTHKSQVVINVENQKFDWIEKVKEGMTLASTDPEAPKIYLLSGQNASSGILGLVNCLKQEPGGHVIRAIFTQNSKQPIDFAKPSPLLQQIMKHDLLVNVIQDEELVAGQQGTKVPVLGSYRHFPLNDGSNVTGSKEIGRASCRERV